MRSLIFIVLIGLISPICGYAQAKNDLSGFISGDLGLFKFIRANIRYPAIAVDREEDGIFFTAIYISKKGELDSVKVLNGVQNKYFEAEIIRGINRTEGMWKNSVVARVVIVPIIFFIYGKDKTNGHYPIEVMPGMDNLIATSQLSTKCVFLAPVMIGRFDVKRP